MSSPLWPDFMAPEQPDHPVDSSKFHVIPAPLEASVSYGTGTVNGPRAILEASAQLEAWDGRSTPLEMGIHTTDPVDCRGDCATALFRIQARVSRSLKEGAIPVLLGGEHTITLGAVRGVYHNLKAPLGIVQFDAHADLRDTYENNPLSHACVMRRILEEMNLPLFQIGVRALSREEHLLREDRGILHLDPGDIDDGGVPAVVLPEDFPRNIYISFDVDGLDPSVIRATGTPVPGGIRWRDALTLLNKVCLGRRVTGYDVVELAPRDQDAASDFAAAQLVYAIMGIIQRTEGAL